MNLKELWISYGPMRWLSPKPKTRKKRSDAGVRKGPRTALAKNIMDLWDLDHEVRQIAEICGCTPRKVRATIARHDRREQV